MWALARAGLVGAARWWMQDPWVRTPRAHLPSVDAAAWDKKQSVLVKDFSPGQPSKDASSLLWTRVGEHLGKVHLGTSLAVQWLRL